MSQLLVNDLEFLLTNYRKKLYETNERLVNIFDSKYPESRNYNINTMQSFQRVQNKQTRLSNLSDYLNCSDGMNCVKNQLFIVADQMIMHVVINFKFFYF